jgi:hypothetical protein
MLTIRSSALGALLIALPLAACGSSNDHGSSAPLSRGAYTQTLHAISLREVRAQASVQKALHARSVASLRGRLAVFAADQEAIAKRLSHLRPPADARGENAKLAAGFADNAAATRNAITEVAHAKTPSAALAKIGKDSSARKSGQEIDAALAGLKKLGYTKGS